MACSKSLNAYRFIGTLQTLPGPMDHRFSYRDRLGVLLDGNRAADIGVARDR